ncbi:tRNA(1)(Val) (adenine(37)-N(6))-methyltransferase TrmN [Dickeya lacustris]|uniref:tRNA1(Val) (adenine(37)-N6)-methyltransferase n=1 Tax=Dickeya lacustris TaxID=2259638 RepID=A0ABY8GAL9_9GAMM|nr:tRNA1(Val) (adenine(37)-N6)-methyltransferase [Dickeya lacustris]WFN56939.1 tRNA1(Val) (adenine(37)-N6)-methyltransferase [Dickeya lacustris]
MSSQHTPARRAGGFTFKQFFVAHDRCAMKVGTDGVLLGAWTPLCDESRVLDIGCGSGLIALMLAQRSDDHVLIDGVELDGAASQQARENVAASAWAHRINIHQQDIQHYAAQTMSRYSLIVSNPPYFSPGVPCGDEQRAAARYTTTLPHQTLLQSAERLLLSEGRFCLVLPIQVAQPFVTLAQQRGWYAGQWVDVADNPSRPFNRVLLTLVREPVTLTRATLVIRDEPRQYSAPFRALTQAFYLSM